MLRASNHGSDSDMLVKIISSTCFGEKSCDIALLFRRMIQTYHERDSGLAGIQACSLSARMLSAIPTARKINMVGTYSVYGLRVGSVDYRCTWRELLAKGSYNYVYTSDLVANNGTPRPAVVKITVQNDKDLRVYLLENVLHAILYSLPQTRDHVVPILGAFKVRQSGYPMYKLGTIMSDPGRGHLGEWIEEHLKNDEQAFAVLTQIAWILHQAQTSLCFEHRDLKCDNIMVSSTPQLTSSVRVPELGLTYSFPTFGIKCLLIDFGMSRLELNGEYIACDCIHTRVTFNKCHDLQNFCCTLLEDYEPELKQSAPRFYKWMRALCAPLYKKILQTWPDYPSASSSKKHERLSHTVHKEKHHVFIPGRMLKLLKEHYLRE
jgi:serine/threonine protein kinase